MGNEISDLRRKLAEARDLLKRAGEHLHIQGDQKARALRFKILNYLRGADRES